jgi:MtfA peptidase
MNIEGAAGFEPTPAVTVVVALKACVPILNLGRSAYGGWRDIVIYPGDFRVQSEYIHQTGVIERASQDLCGQTLLQGPMVLSWQTIEEEREAIDRDVVIHECAHKLDIVNGNADGFPLLPASIPVAQWSRTWRSAYDGFVKSVDAGEHTRLDPYGAADPAEFFAVLTETFFTDSAIVALDFPDVYQQLARFFRQDPNAIMQRTNKPVVR